MLRHWSALDFCLVLGAAALLGYLFYPTLEQIALICWNDDDYSHGVLLPLVSAYMLWDQRDAIKQRLDKVTAEVSDNPNGAVAQKERSLLIPELLLVFGLVLFFVGEASGISYASWIAFFPTLIAVIHLLFGRAVMWIAAPPVLLLFMAKPLPDSVVVRIFWPLQTFAARVSKESLRLFDVPVYLSGNIIEIPQMKLMVEEACSGMRSVMALLTLALVVIYFVPLRWFNRLLLVACSVLIAVVLNVLRVAMTGFLAHFYDPATATGFFHTFSGMVVFVIGLPLLYYTGLGLTKLEKHRTKTA